MTTFYLDPVAGSDAADGLSFANRWLTMTSGATAARIASGDVVRIMQSPAPTSLGVDGTWTNQSGTITLASEITDNVYMDGAWTASASVTCSTSTNRKEGANSSTHVIAAGFTTGKASRYATGTLDLSGFQQISFAIMQTAGTLHSVSTRLSLKLCSDTTGDTPVDSIDIPALGATNAWHFFTVDTGGALGAAIESIALYVNSDQGAQTFQIDNVIVCEAPSAADCLNLNSLIGPSSTGPWYPICSINGTTVLMDGNDPTTGAGTTVMKYQGPTDTVTTYVRRPLLLPSSASASTIWGTINEANVDFSGGWDSTDMSTQPGETWLSSPAGYMNSLTGGAFAGNDIEKIGYARMGSVTIGSQSASTIQFEGLMGLNTTTATDLTADCDLTIGTLNLPRWTSLDFTSVNNLVIGRLEQTGETTTTSLGTNLTSIDIGFIGQGVIDGSTIRLEMGTASAGLINIDETNVGVGGSETLNFTTDSPVTIGTCNSTISTSTVIATQDIAITTLTNSSNNNLNSLTSGDLTITTLDIGGTFTIGTVGTRTNRLTSGNVTITNHTNGSLTLRGIFSDNSVSVDDGTHMLFVGALGNFDMAGSTLGNITATTNSNVIVRNVNGTGTLVVDGCELTIINDGVGAMGAISAVQNGGILRVQNYNASTTDHRIIYADLGTTQSETSVRHTASGLAWKLTPAAATTSSKPLFLESAKIAVNSGSLVTVKAWLRRADTGLSLGIRVVQDDSLGIVEDTELMTAAVDTWEEVTLTFTPTAAGVAEIWCVGYGSATAGYIDDMTITQA